MISSLDSKILLIFLPMLNSISYGTTKVMEFAHIVSRNATRVTSRLPHLWVNSFLPHTRVTRVSSMLTMKASLILDKMAKLTIIRDIEALHAHYNSQNDPFVSANWVTLDESTKIARSIYQNKINALTLVSMHGLTHYYNSLFLNKTMLTDYFSSPEAAA